MPAHDDLQERIAADSDIAELARDLADRLHEQTTASARAVLAMRQASERVTNIELGRWQESATKRWSAQMEVVSRHGLPTGRPGSASLIARQIRRCWLGSAVGIVLPIWTFGFSTLTHGLLVPLCWVLAVVADVAGKAACLRFAPVARAALVGRSVHGPENVGNRVRAALRDARQSGVWDDAIKAGRYLKAATSAMESGEALLERRGEIGRRVVGGCASFVLLIELLLLDVVGHDAQRMGLLVTLLLFVLGAVFGGAMWMTAASYDEILARPPYPRALSLPELLKSIRYETALASVPENAFATAAQLRDFSTERMRRIREFSVALRALERCEKSLKRARADLAMLIGHEVDLKEVQALFADHSRRQADHSLRQADHYLRQADSAA